MDGMELEQAMCEAEAGKTARRADRIIYVCDHCGLAWDVRVGPSRTAKEFNVKLRKALVRRGWETNDRHEWFCPDCKARRKRQAKLDDQAARQLLSQGT